MRRHLALCCWFTVFLSSAGAQWSPPEPPDPPHENEPTVEKRHLGKVLFWDEQLSSDMSVACGTCHALGGADPRALDADLNGARHPGVDGEFGTSDDVRGSPGVVAADASGQLLAGGPFPFRPSVTNRKAPSIYNSAFFARLFWDGRATGEFRDPETGELVLPAKAALENLSLQPLVNPVEMAHEGRTLADVVERLESVKPLALADQLSPDVAQFVGNLQRYGPLFAKTFGDEEITPTRIALALGNYLRSLNSSDTPADRFILGDTDALTPKQQAGHDLFFGKARCSLCHVAPLFGNSNFFNTGVRPAHEDPGLGASYPPAAGAFKTPSLRNTGLQAPYFHNGGADTLEEVVDFYDRGGDFLANISPLMQPLGLNPAEKANLVDFLRHGLTDERVVLGLPPFDRPRLATERGLGPAHLGPGTEGAGGTPHIVAAGPAVLGRDGFTVGVHGGVPGMPAALLVSDVHDPQLVDGLQLHVGLGAIQRVFFAGALQGLGAADGHALVRQDLPLDPALDGLVVFAQWILMDPATSSGLSSSEALRLEFFLPRGH